MAWTCFEGDAVCGSCRVTIVAGDPVALVANGKRHRCASCAGQMGLEVDWEQVDQAKFERERRAWADRQAATADPMPAPARRLPPPRQPVPLSAIADTFFDPKAAAANDGRDS